MHVILNENYFDKYSEQKKAKPDLLKRKKKKKFNKIQSQYLASKNSKKKHHNIFCFTKNDLFYLPNNFL
jgi:hypothetical protein